MEKTDNGHKNFLVQGAILGAAAIIVRFLGLLYQMPLTRIIGDLGNGYYSYAYNVYSMVLLISSFSIPLAVSKMISSRLAKHRFREAQRVFQISMAYVVVISVALGLLTFIFAGSLIPKSQGGAVPALRVLCPVIVLSGILGVLRGYFQGYGTMIPTSVSQIAEGLLNAIISVLMAYILVIPYAAGTRKRAVYGAVGSTLGTAAGVIIGLVFLIFVYFAYRPVVFRRIKKDRHRRIQSDSEILKVIFMTVTPVIAGSLVYNICPVIDQTIFALILEKKDIADRSISVLYGIYSAKYLKLTSVPLSVASALSNSIIPAIAVSVAKNRTKDACDKIDTAMKFTMLVAFPCTVGLMVLARPIMLLFGRQYTLVIAVHVLIFGAVSIVFNCISTLTNAVLQGLDDMRSPLIHSLIALAAHIITAVVLLYAGLGIYALLIANMVFAIIIWILNGIKLGQITGYRKPLGSRTLGSAFSSLAMGLVTYVVYQLFMLLFKNEYICLVIALAVAVVSYLFFLLLLDVLTEEDFEIMPFGDRIRSIGVSLHLVEAGRDNYDERAEKLAAAGENIGSSISGVITRVRDTTDNAVRHNRNKRHRPLDEMRIQDEHEENAGSESDEPGYGDESPDDTDSPASDNFYVSPDKQETIDHVSDIDTGDPTVRNLLATLRSETPKEKLDELRDKKIREEMKSEDSSDYSESSDTDDQASDEAEETAAPEKEESETLPEEEKDLPQEQSEVPESDSAEKPAEPPEKFTDTVEDTSPINVAEIISKARESEEKKKTGEDEDISAESSKNSGSDVNIVPDVSKVDYSQMSLDEIIKTRENDTDNVDVIDLDDDPQDK